MRPVLFQHHKGGLYVMTAVSSDSSNEEPRVGSFAVYYSLEQCAYRMRPLSEFHELVKLPDGREVQRFTPVSKPCDIRHWLPGGNEPHGKDASEAV